MDAPLEHHVEFQCLTHLSEQVECPLRNAQDSRMVYDMLWSDPAVADPVPCLPNNGRFFSLVARSVALLVMQRSTVDLNSLV